MEIVSKKKNAKNDFIDIVKGSEDKAIDKGLVKKYAEPYYAIIEKSSLSEAEKTELLESVMAKIDKKIEKLEKISGKLSNMKDSIEKITDENSREIMALSGFGVGLLGMLSQLGVYILQGTSVIDPQTAQTINNNYLEPGTGLAFISAIGLPLVSGCIDITTTALHDFVDDKLDGKIETLKMIKEKFELLAKDLSSYASELETVNNMKME